VRGWPEVELAVIGTVPLLYKTESGELGELTVMLSVSGVMLKLWETEVAAAKLPVTPWAAVMVQVPTPTSVITPPPVTVQMLAEDDVL
jgi:hypothetical protein